MLFWIGHCPLPYDVPSEGQINHMQSQATSNQTFRPHGMSRAALRVASLAPLWHGLLQIRLFCACYKGGWFVFVAVGCILCGQTARDIVWGFLSDGSCGAAWLPVLLSIFSALKGPEGLGFWDNLGAFGVDYILH